MRVVICTIGSGGDVHPYIALGVELRRRGHEVVLLVNPHFHARARTAGLEVESLGTEEQYAAVIKSPDLIHPTRGPRFVLGTLVREPSREMFVTTRRLIRDHRADVVVRHLIAFGAGWAAQREGIPTACGVLAPLFWLSRIDPPAFKRSLFQNAPVWMRRLRMKIARTLAPYVLTPLVNAARADCDLPPVKNAFVREIRGGDINLGLWSPAYRAALADDPPHGRICGFCSFDGAEAMPEPLERFLDAGPPPIVFTLGTSVVHHAGEFYTMAADVARRLNRRAVLLAGEAADAITGLGPDVFAARYAPFDRLLARGCATVHHGGVGTTGSALRAGRPMVIVPHANDEFDNADRARRLGVSATVHTNKLSAARLESALCEVLNNPAAAARAESIARSMSGENGPAAAADALEQLAARRATSVRGAQSPQPA
ncbi:MAG: glycosyltransferase [Phycisphaerales bacterium]